MDHRALTDRYAVAPQLQPEEMVKLAEAGVTVVICNRPDSEVPPELQAAALQEAAEAAGLQFVYNPVVGFGMSHEAIDEQADAIEQAEGQVVAYCASGMRSALIWALSASGQIPTDEILATVSKAGYPMDHLFGQIEGIGKMRR
ncbi:MAG: TIGR01244 family sulfur transferase [Pseudomonadota bacterium]